MGFFFFFNSNMVYTNGFESIKQNKKVRTSKLKRSICQIAPLFLTEFNGSYLFWVAFILFVLFDFQVWSIFFYCTFFILFFIFFIFQFSF
jgi:hypothetical protein